MRGGIDSARVTVRQSLTESPFTIQTNIQAAEYQPSRDPAEARLLLRKSYAASATGGVSYRTRSGWEAHVNGSVAQDRYQGYPELQPPFPSAIGRPYQVTLGISYDLVRGGSQGREKTIEGINAYRAWQEFYARHQRLIDARLEFIQLLLDVFVTSCKIAELQTAQGDVARTVHQGKVQVDTKTIAYKDYLTPFYSPLARRSR